jgi:hypothetical protein
VIQALPLLLADRDIVILTGRITDESVYSFYEGLGIARRRLQPLVPGMRVKLLFLSCDTPRMVHPVALFGFRQTLGVSDAVQCEARDTIFVIPRNGSDVRNGGRNLLNLDAVFALLEQEARALAPELGLQRLKVTLLDTKQVPAMLIRTLQRARLLLGPHGGGLYNHVLAPTHTAVLEITSSIRVEQRRGSYPIFWRMTDAVGQPFFQMQASRPLVARFVSLGAPQVSCALAPPRRWPRSTCKATRTCGWT